MTMQWQPGVSPTVEVPQIQFIATFDETPVVQQRWVPATTATGAAMRRRQQRLRQFMRHECLSVAMALAEALHHSSGLLTKKVVERREGPEGEVRETHYALRGQKRPLPGTPLAPLPVVAEPHGRPEAAARVSVGVPSLVLVALSSADEGVDAAALSFLVQQAVLAQEKEKEEEKRKEKEKELQEMFARLTGEYLRELSQASSSSSPRRRKKRKKEKLPKTSSHSALVIGSGSGMLGLLVLLVTFLLALCSLFVFTPEMLGILVGVDQKDIYAAT